MAEPTSFLADLEDAVSRGTAESCLQALWHATDVLIAGQYSEDQIWTFGEIIGRLAEDIEIAARVRLANKLAPSNNAPVKIIKKLAFDDSIDVAGLGSPIGSIPKRLWLMHDPRANSIFWLFRDENPSPMM
jgi:hypothetical protein